MSIFGRNQETSLVDDLRANVAKAIVCEAIAIFASIICSVSCREIFQQAQVSQQWLTVLVWASLFAAMGGALYAVQTLNYLCLYNAKPTVLQLAPDKQYRRYRYGCWCGCLSVLISGAAIALTVWLMFRLKHPRNLFPPFRSSMLLLIVAICAIVQIVITIKTAWYIHRTTKWWREERQSQPGLRFSEFAHTPIGYEDDEDDED